MPARIFFVHDDRTFLEPATAALRSAGFDVVPLTSSLAAVDALEDAKPAELLITRVNFPQGTPHGAALAGMAGIKRPGIKVLFVARPEMREHTVGFGEFMPAPVSPSALVTKVTKLLKS